MGSSHPAVRQIILMIAVCMLAFVADTEPRTDLPAVITTAVDNYCRALAAAKSTRDRKTIESVFTAARELKRALLLSVGDSTAIEQLTENQFRGIATRAVGVIINREEVLLVEPDPRYFLSLAQTHGTPADIAFFKVYSATYPDGVWPSYVWQETDVTGCTAFGSGELLARYGDWRGYRAQYPKAYGIESRERLREIEWHVAESDCACGSRVDVMKELQSFAAAFSRTGAGRAAKRRLLAMTTGKSSIKFDCSSG